VQYFEEARVLWRQFVPRTGQATTVQGELIRAVEKLRREAQRNGNVNWSDGHETLARFVSSTLTGSDLFPPPVVGQINADVARILRFGVPATSDEPYDRLTDRVVQWARAHPEPIPHERNPDLHL
jgi:hypothetical protein